MSEARPRERRRGWLLRRFVRDERGVTAVEFGLIALPFFALLCAILETALLFLAGQILDTALADTARLIRTGQAQQQGFTQAKFREQLCGQLAVFFDCGNRLYVDVRKYQNFSSIDTSLPVDGNRNIVNNFQYDAGKGGDIVVVKAYYEWPLIFNKFGLQLDTLSNGNHLLGSVTAFRNEPFPW